MSSAKTEAQIQERGRRLLKALRAAEARIQSRRQQKTLSIALKSPRLKTSLLRFVDVLPSLKSPDQILSLIREYFKEGDLGLLSKGLARLPPALAAAAAKKQVLETAKIFIAGSSGRGALKTLAGIRQNGMAFSLDLLGEATLSEAEGESYQKKYLDLMDILLEAKSEWAGGGPRGGGAGCDDYDQMGAVPSVNLSVKATALYSQIREEAWEHSKRELKKRLRPLFQKAAEKFIFLNLDMEQYRHKRLFMEIFQELLMEDDLKNYPHFGLAAQACLKESFEDIKNLIAFARRRRIPFSVRLVKGAYWDSEVLTARQKNWPIPVYAGKALTDLNFERCAALLLQSGGFVKTAIASHNIRSIACALAIQEKNPNSCLEFQTLYGIGEAAAEALKGEGLRPRLYTPVGELLPGISYLVRRLLENSSSQSFILSAVSKNQPAEILLAPPAAAAPAGQKAGLRGGAAEGAASGGGGEAAIQYPPAENLWRRVFYKKTGPANPPNNESGSRRLQGFQNYPPLDFSIRQNRERFQQALEAWRRKLPSEVPLMIEGRELRSLKILERENPARSDQLVSRAHLCGEEQAERAVQTAADFFETYRDTPAEERIACLERLASLIQEREFELSALETLETGKPWAEAHADVAEAIDFCRYYAESFRQLSKRRRNCEISGEESFSSYEPAGPAAVIAPWNFPLAILTGMTAAPLVCGSPVLIKPAEQSPLTALQLARLLLKSGFPKESFAFLPGRGERIGAFLARHRKVPIVSFTGSFETGAQIIKETSAAAGGRFEGQRRIKRLILEMGGKNAIILDSSADLDEAIPGILASAFGFQGQKCSACSRALIVEDIYERFIERFLPAAESLIQGPPEQPESFIGPLIDRESLDRVRRFLKQEEGSFQVLYKGKELEGGWFLPPMALACGDPNAPLMQKELFAPVLAIAKAGSFEQALQIANNSRFGLTAGLYSRRPSHIEMFKRRAEAGNIYINRNCVGAMVQRHPFGGRKMSGLGSKAGGPEYLKQFLREKTCAENTMRRGFSPEIFSEDFLRDLA